MSASVVVHVNKTDEVAAVARLISPEDSRSTVCLDIKFGDLGVRVFLPADRMPQAVQIADLIRDTLALPLEAKAVAA